MEKILLKAPILEICTMLFLYIIITSMLKVNYVKTKTIKSNPFISYAILIIKVGVLSYLMLFAINEHGKNDIVQVHFAVWFYGIVLLKYVLPVLIIFFCRNIYKYIMGKANINPRFITSILIIITVLMVYHMPHKNIIKASADEVYMYTDNREDNGGNKRIDDIEESERLLTIINRYTFLRTADRSIMHLKNENEKLCVYGTFKGKIYSFGVSKYDNNETILQINYNLYKVINKEKFDEEIFNLDNFQ